MKLPNRDIGGFAREVIARCTNSQTARIQRGITYRNLFLTGDAEGNPQTFNKTNLYIEKLASWLYSPVDMRFGMESDTPISPTEKAMGRIAVGELHKRLRRGNVDRKVGEAVKWSLIKGKAFIKLRWAGGIEADLIQPEVMGVEREDIGSLDQQQAFVHSSWYTIDNFVKLVWNQPDKDLLLRRAKAIASMENQSKETSSMLKQVVVGGAWNGVYQAAGSTNPQQQRGWVNWLSAPSPNLAPELAARLLQVNELYVWDDDRDDWTTITMLADAGDDAVIFGKYQHRNLFADAFDTEDKSKKGRPNPDNPLHGCHPFVEFCPNELDGYFWGRSELDNCALLQHGINKRIDGINDIMRRQEKPPRVFIGMSGATQQSISRLARPGGYMTEPNPNGKIQDMAPEMPPTLFQTLHELVQLFDDIGGVTSTLGGQGDQGVRSQAHAETLLRSSTPHIKDRAIDVERSVSEVGNLGLTMMKAMVPETYTAWVRMREAGIESGAAVHENVDEPPVKDLAPVRFILGSLPDSMYVTIDGHSSSPAFMHEHQQLMLTLAARGAVSPAKLIESLHPPHENELLVDLEQKAVDQAEMIKEHPEILTKGKKPQGQQPPPH